MANCVNVNSKEFKELKRQTNITEKVLAAKIGVWQDKNGLDKFPSKEDIYLNMAIPHRVGLFKKEISNLEKNLVLDRIRIYNTKNIPIYIDFKKVGEADLFTWELRDNTFYQESSIPNSTASKETLEKINKVAEAMGIKITTLQEYAKGNPEIDTSDLNGVADLTQKVIAIAEGQEDVALTEEVIHIATAILEQTTPGVITEMISKIGRFKIYKEVFEKYKNLKAYQNADGTPNIRKIKKEAVDKLLVEVIINGAQESDMNPELREEETISLAKKWWNTILDFISGNYRKTNLDIFKSVGEYTSFWRYWVG